MSYKQVTYYFNGKEVSEPEFYATAFRRYPFANTAPTFNTEKAIKKKEENIAAIAKLYMEMGVRKRQEYLRDLLTEIPY